MSHSASRLSFGLIGLSLVLGGCLLPQPHTPPVGLGLPGLVSKAPPAAKPADRIQAPNPISNNNGTGNALISQPPSAPKTEPPIANGIPPTVESQTGAPVAVPAAAPLQGGGNPAANSCAVAAGTGYLTIDSPAGVVYTLRVAEDTLSGCGNVAPSEQGPTSRSWVIQAGRVTVMLDLSKPAETSLKTDIDIQEGQPTRLQLVQDPQTQEWQLKEPQPETPNTRPSASPTPPSTESDQPPPQVSQPPSVTP